MNKGIKGTFGAAAMIAVLGAGGCMTDEHHGRHAVAELSPASGSNVRGTVRFEETGKGIRVVANVTGLTPGKHGFHVHAKGDCSAPDASSAGGHFNPANTKHGGPKDAERHAGDFGNITADASGTAKADFVDTHISFDGPNSIVGKGVIVHEKEDDLVSQQPTPGNAGKRVACGTVDLH
jgi:superoxide dismutase, Cu-Zn family